MARIIAVCVGWLITALSVSGQVVLPLSTDPASLAMGGLISPLSGVYQPAGNPASLAAMRGTGISAFTLQPFGLQELSTSYIYGSHRQGKGGWGGGIGYSGFAGLRHLSAFSGFGHRLWNRLDAGIQVEWQEMRLSDFGRQHRLGVSAGLRASLHNDLVLGLVLRNPPLFRGADNRYLPSALIGTLAYRVSGQVDVAVEWYQEENLTPDFRFGMQYRPLPSLPIRIGYQAAVGAFAAGAGFAWRARWQLDLSAGYHPFLGFSPAAGLTWTISGTE
jgi:hypothetical protein